MNLTRYNFQATHSETAMETRFSEFSRFQWISISSRQEVIRQVKKCLYQPISKMLCLVRRRPTNLTDYEDL